MSWGAQARDWSAVATSEHLDPFFWRVNRRAIESLLPIAEVSRVLDIGAGEGRVARIVAERGHSVCAIDAAMEMARAALRSGLHRVIRADASALPIATGSVGGITSLMLLMSVDDLDGALLEMARVLCWGGWMCLGVLHPLVTSGAIDDEGMLSVAGYGVERRLPVRMVERHGHRIQFDHVHRPISAYLDATRRAGLQVERVVEPLPEAKDLAAHSRLRRWATIPNALLWSARKS